MFISWNMSVYKRRMFTKAIIITMPHYNLSTALSSVRFSHSVMSNHLQPHGLQHATPPCPLPTPRVYSNSCPLSQWCLSTISSCVIHLLPPSIFPSIRVLSNEPVLPLSWLKYWSFSCKVSPSNEHSGLNSSWRDWLDLLAVQGTQKHLLQYHNSKASILYSPSLTSIHDYWKNHSFD